jgi:hypothetical protein
MSSSSTRTVAINLGGRYVGRTLAAQLLDSAGASVGSEITTEFTELGGGSYLLSLTADDSFSGALKVYESGDSTNPLATVAIEPPNGTSTLTAQQVTNALDAYGTARTTDVQQIFVGL